MKDLHGKVSVITGAASGFGREFAIRCADEGMKVVLTDIDTGGLGTTVALLKPGTESLVIGSDVSSADSIEHLATSTYDRFGACHLLFNNAGVGTAGAILEGPPPARKRGVWVKMDGGGFRVGGL